MTIKAFQKNKPAGCKMMDSVRKKQNYILEDIGGGWYSKQKALNRNKM